MTSQYRDAPRPAQSHFCLEKAKRSDCSSRGTSACTKAWGPQPEGSSPPVPAVGLGLGLGLSSHSGRPKAGPVRLCNPSNHLQYHYHLHPDGVLDLPAAARPPVAAHLVSRPLDPPQPLPVRGLVRFCNFRRHQRTAERLSSRQQLAAPGLAQKRLLAQEGLAQRLAEKLAQSRARLAVSPAEQLPRVYFPPAPRA